MRAMRAFEEPRRVVCCVTNCRSVVEKGKIMCLTHWLLVPPALQREVGETYRSRQMGLYQDAYRRAVDHVESATGVFTGILEKRAVRDPAREESEDFLPIASPSKTKMRRPRLTMRRLVAIEEALLFRLEAAVEGECAFNASHEAALLWVDGQIAAREARGVPRI